MDKSTADDAQQITQQTNRSDSLSFIERWIRDRREQKPQSKVIEAIELSINGSTVDENQLLERLYNLESE